mgnify:CR=1 FL=1
MVEEEAKKEKAFYQKWWFWLIILAISVVVGFIIIMGIAFNFVTTGINEVALSIQKIDNEATVYTSAGQNTIVIEIPNYTDETKKDKEEAIISLLKEYSSDSETLSDYSKVILCEKINSDNNIKNYFLTTKVYLLPNMNEDVEQEEIYIDFVEYTKQSLSTTTPTINSAEEQKGVDITLTAGKYTVGEDVKPGKYDVIAQAGSGNFFVKGSNSVNEILSVDASKNANYGYIDKYTNLTLKNGDTLELRSNLKILLQAK